MINLLRNTKGARRAARDWKTEKEERRRLPPLFLRFSAGRRRSPQDADKRRGSMGETGLVALAQNFAQKTENFYSFCRKDMVYSEMIKWRAGHGGGETRKSVRGGDGAQKFDSPCTRTNQK